MNKKNVIIIIVSILCIFIACVCVYNIYNFVNDGVKESFTWEEIDIIEKEYKLEFDDNRIRAGYCNSNNLVINVGPFFDKESLLECFEFKNNTLYREILERCSSGNMKYKMCFNSIVDAYAISTSNELISETEYIVYIYSIQDIWYFEIQKDKVELAETLEIFD